jgi:hypothetical protein
MTSRADKNRLKKAKTVAKAQEPKRTANVVSIRTAPASEPVRDGLVWLIRKNRINPRQRIAAAAYRQAYREPQPGAIRSHLDDAQGSGGHTGNPPDCNAAFYDAQVRLKSYRTEALQDHGDMISVMDAVAGNGLTFTELSPKDYRQAERLEAILKIALDLMAQHLDKLKQATATPCFLKITG